MKLRLGYEAFCFVHLGILQLIVAILPLDVEVGRVRLLAVIQIDFLQYIVLIKMIFINPAMRNFVEAVCVPVFRLSRV